MTNEEAKLHVMTELTRSLAYAADVLSVDRPTQREIDDAFVEVVFVLLFLRLSLKEQFGCEVSEPQMIESERFGRIETELMSRVDDMNRPVT